MVRYLIINNWHWIPKLVIQQDWQMLWNPSRPAVNIHLYLMLCNSGSYCWNCINFKSIQTFVRASSVPWWPVHWTKYKSWHLRRLSIFESSISETSNSMSPSTSIGGGGGWTRFGIVFGVAGLSCETWKTGCTARSWSGSRRVNDARPTCAIISKGPRFFSDNFLEGHMVRKWAALTKTLSPMSYFKYDL